MTATPEELYPPPPPKIGAILAVEVTCQAPDYEQTFNSTQQQPNGFYPWTVLGAGNPTSFTLTATAFAADNQKAVPATVEVKIVAQDIDINFNGPGGSSPLNDSVSGSGDGTAKATLDVDLTKNGATPNNNFQMLATVTVNGAGAGKSTSVTVPMIIVEPEG